MHAAEMPAPPDAIPTLLPPRPPLRAAVTAATRLPEPQAVAALLEAARLPAADAQAVAALAARIASSLRAREPAAGRAGLVQGLLQEFALNSQEGVALMCLAEALLRIPDAATRDALIRDKVGGADWRAHAGNSPSLFVNAATWGLLLTGRLVATHSDAGLAAALRRIVSRGGEPLIRKAVDMAVRLMGEQFVTGERIGEALAHARGREAEGFRHSYDMLGEAALTAADAQRYLAAYEEAIDAIGAAAAGRSLHDGPGISIKLSALHPRYVRAQRARVMDELYPRLLRLAQRARRHGIGLNVDAEESDRLEPSLDLLERLCHEPSLEGWDGIGFVVQAYQKRCPAVLELLIDLARRSGRRLMLRLVKGAYWDSEIKRAQVDGLDGFPVYTRKAHTDLAYIACARRMLAVPDAIYPQFATHNAQTLATVHHLAGPDDRPGRYEFQCLHGMGEPLYEPLVRPRAEGGLGIACRIYAPVGTHETLLAYLVRRLLENGANTSFVNRIADASIPLEALLEDPVRTVERTAADEGAIGLPHPAIRLPAELYGTARVNSAGVDLADESGLAALREDFAAARAATWRAAPGGYAGGDALGGGILGGGILGGGILGGGILSGDALGGNAADGDATHGDAATAQARGGQAAGHDAAGTDRGERPVVNPADRRDVAGTDRGERPVVNPADRRDVVGTVRHTDARALQAAIARAVAAAPAWAATPPAARAAALERAADRMQAGLGTLASLMVREAGKTWPCAVAEVREAVDFLRHDAAQVREGFSNDTHRPLGTVACISPWNFPLAIFTGQVAAALAAGNTVLAKPAEQTPLVAAQAVRILHEAGVPPDALQLVPGPGATVGAALAADARVQGVLFTGSTAVARQLQRTLAARLGPDGRAVPLVAETGGQNAMLVDSSALAEQVVADVLASAFDSAGQRCSALRVLYVQHEAADRVLGMLEGAMRELRVGDPASLATDVGPVIDAQARDRLLAHVEAMRASGHRVVQPLRADAPALAHGSFVVPTIIELERLSELPGEVFGPVLHVLRHGRDELDRVLDDIEATGYALTLGVHTRIDETIAQVLRRSRAGNVYVNRNMVGAVVGVQPFGGEGLSGTGPKAGGPLYLLRLLSRRPDDAPARAIARCGAPAGQAAAPWLPRAAHAPAPDPALRALEAWAAAGGDGRLAQACARLAAVSPIGPARRLAGPTGQADLYLLRPRDAVLCLAADDADRLVQLAAVLAVGAGAVWPAGDRALRARLPTEVAERIVVAQDWTRDGLPLDAVLHHGDAAALGAVCAALAARPGPIVGVEGLAPGDGAVPLERLVVERSLSVNTAAAGGNASLMTIG
jgi:RHH-type proline utilization regulon transcriptional repressor/proline dehydrogenase/delta 1-pyrroline-5-carboxylate dehydrogenase